jgi:GR25 family glycosyltransferase involved in LPS biosynthesis
MYSVQHLGYAIHLENSEDSNKLTFEKFEKLFVINLPVRTDHHDAMLVTAAASNIQINWIDGVNGSDILDKVLPPEATRQGISNVNIGSWSAHMNAMVAVVEQNLTSALILEDDADWDVRIKPQLRDFALSSQALI